MNVLDLVILLQMSFRNAVNDISSPEVVEKPTVKLYDLEMNKKFKILLIKFGESVLDLADCSVSH